MITRIIINRTMSKKINSKIITIILFSFSLIGCSTYPNKFKCGDARGLGCTMMHEVDRQIDSGQIAEAYIDRKDRKCRNKHCDVSSTNEILNLKQQDKAASYPEEAKKSLDDDYNLHF